MTTARSCLLLTHHLPRTGRPLYSRVTMLHGAQLHAADLSRDCLRQIAEFDASNALVRSQAFATEREDRAGCFHGRWMARLEHDERLRYGVAQRVGARYHGGLDESLVLD